ncbi:Acetyltransferase [Archaeoglobus sulfaticallidus PM70-1]|uniref:Acetyltransferase n=1 Tax=Archaeoglobus sulfaticallidus PM70-1 TaxID=387631 RepID=N0BB15_9EURY|nr:GNAT family N-acetyltransferase [Archaeoglobus sulfaticallidus]AGK60799.1 Acetyltransferase [Archaeoglobus sulfaticallidus PM70-1]
MEDFIDGCTIRKVDRSDLEAFVNIYIEAYRGLEEYAYTKRKEIKNYFKWLRNRDEDGFMVLEGDEIIGFVACDTNWVSIFDRLKVGEIHELVLHPEYRNKGFGSFLLNKAVEYAKSKDRKLAELWVGEKNYRARKFYMKNGFNEKGKWGIWIRMVKKI